MKTTDKKYLEFELSRFESLVKSAPQELVPERAHVIITEFKELLGYTVQMDRHFIKLLDEMKKIRTELEAQIEKQRNEKISFIVSEMGGRS